MIYDVLHSIDLVDKNAMHAFLTKCRLAFDNSAYYVYHMLCMMLNDNCMCAQLLVLIIVIITTVYVYTVYYVRVTIQNKRKYISTVLLYSEMKSNKLLIVPACASKEISAFSAHSIRSITDTKHHPKQHTTYMPLAAAASKLYVLFKRFM